MSAIPVDKKYLSDMTDRSGHWTTLEVDRVQALLDERDALKCRLNEVWDIARESQKTALMLAHVEISSAGIDI